MYLVINQRTGGTVMRCWSYLEAAEACRIANKAADGARLYVVSHS